MLILNKVKYNILAINLPYIIVTFIYAVFTWIILGMSVPALWITYFCYLISLIVAFSIVGEYILRFLMNVRRPMTKKEKEYLIPIFMDVYNKVLLKRRRKFTRNGYNISKNIGIYISDSMSIDAYCFGSRTIVVTKGAIKTFSEEQLKGIIAHEFGHIVHGNTKALLFNKIGNGIFSLAFLPIALIFKLTEKGIKFTENSTYNSKKVSPTLFIISIIKAIINTAQAFLNLFSGIILSANSRYCEYLADYYASCIGYGEELTEALYLISELSFTNEHRMNKRLLQDHPIIAKRIERLEIYSNYQSMSINKEPAIK